MGRFVPVADVKRSAPIAPGAVAASPPLLDERDVGPAVVEVAALALTLALTLAFTLAIGAEAELLAELVAEKLTEERIVRHLFEFGGDFGDFRRGDVYHSRQDLLNDRSEARMVCWLIRVGQLQR